MILRGPLNSLVKFLNYFSIYCVKYVTIALLFQIQDGTCILSSKTGSDVGGLYNQGLQEVHHFEMKPLLGIILSSHYHFRNNLFLTLHFEVLIHIQKTNHKGEILYRQWT